MAPPICTDHLVTVPEMEYVCPIGDNDSDSEPPVSKRQKKWILNIAEEWDLDDIVTSMVPRQAQGKFLLSSRKLCTHFLTLHMCNTNQ